MTFNFHREKMMTSIEKADDNQRPPVRVEFSAEPL